MKLTALVASCLLAVALAGPVPVPQQQQQYIIRRPNNAVSLHSQAHQIQGGQQPFLVQLDDDSEEEDRNLLSLQGVGNFVANVPEQRTRTFSAGGSAQLNVRLDDDSIESDEIFFQGACPSGQLRHGNRCVVPRINRNIFVFGKDDPPEPKSVDFASLPLPQLDYNIIFVRSKPARSRRPVVIPPPQKKTVVYVLEDETDSIEDIIEVPSHPESDPEVYYVKVRPGENPQLPGGIDLQTAYSQAIQPGGQGAIDFDSSIELIIGGGAGGLSGISGGSGFGGSGFSGTGAESVGVPLPSFGGSDAGFGGSATFDSSLSGFSSAGDVGVPLPSFGGSADFSASGSAIGTGVPLPSFQGGSGGFDSTNAFSSNAGFSSDTGFSGAGFSGNAQLAGENFAATSQFDSLAAKGLEVEIDDGRIEVELASVEVVQPAIRYQLPQQG